METKNSSTLLALASLHLEIANPSFGFTRLENLPFVYLSMQVAIPSPHHGNSYTFCYILEVHRSGCCLRVSSHLLVFVVRSSATIFFCLQALLPFHKSVAPYPPQIFLQQALLPSSTQNHHPQCDNRKHSGVYLSHHIFLLKVKSSHRSNTFLCSELDHIAIQKPFNHSKT